MKVEISGLNMVYRNGIHALRDINLEFETGLLGLLGPNGAGKTTLMKILVTLLNPSSGTVLYDGINIQRHRKNTRALLGYLPQTFSTFSNIKTWEYLDYSGALAGLTKKKDRDLEVDRLLDQVGLSEVRNRMANKLSGGMKRRLGIAQALIGNPKIIIVDEPTTGLDTEERIKFRNILSELTQRDVTVVISTHIIGDISSSCHNIAIISQGEVSFFGTPSKLIEHANGHVFELSLTNMEYASVKNKYNIISTIPVENGYKIEIVSEDKPDHNYSIIPPNIEHAYVYYLLNNRFSKQKNS